VVLLVIIILVASFPLKAIEVGGKIFPAEGKESTDHILEASEGENFDVLDSMLLKGENEFAENPYRYAPLWKICGIRECDIPSRDTVGTNVTQWNKEKTIKLKVSTGAFKLVTIEFKDKKWQLILCNNTKNLNNYGKPTVPYKKLLIPLNDNEVVDVEVEEECTKDFLKVDILPGFKPLPLGSSYLNGLDAKSYFEKYFYIDPSIYRSDRAFPPRTVTYETIVHGNNRILVLKVFPFRFYPTRSKIEVFDIHINITLSETAFGGMRFSSSSLQQEDPKYVIVTPSAFSSAVESFATWKEQLGFSVQKTTLEYIYNNFPGRDKAEKLREFIKESYYTNGSEYYLLVGDSDVCPAREVWDPAMGPGLDNGTEPCDLYFECLDGDWDANGNSLFGEMDDDVDFFPEVKVGRLPVNTVQEATTVCEKIRKVEENPEPGNWIRKFLLIANTAFTYGDCAAALDEEINQKFLAGSFFDVIRLYDVDGSLSPSAVTSAMNQGVGLVDFFDHGAYDTWVGALQTNDVLNLMNGNKTFLAYAMACETAAFDYQQYTTISEAFFKNPNGGAIAYIGATRVAWAGYDCFDGLHHRFWTNFLTQATANMEAHPKDALQSALIEMASTYDMSGASRETVFQTIYFGDPALNLYWKHNITTTVTPNLETNETGTINGICWLLHSGMPISGQYEAVVRDPVGNLIAQQSGTLGAQGNYTMSFCTSTIPGNYTVETSVVNPFNYTHRSQFTVGTLNVTLKLSSIPVYGALLELSGRVLDGGTPVLGQVNVSIVNDGVIVGSQAVAVNASGQYETQINITTFGRQELHVWASNLADTKHGGTSAAFEVKRGDILILVDDSGDMMSVYPGGWYDLNRGSSTSYYYFYAALEDEYRINICRILYDPVPNLNFLQQYSAVVVTCGDHYGACLTSVFRHLTEVLTQYHNSGGDLLFEGGDLAYSLSSRGYVTFMHSVLHIDFISDIYNPDLHLDNSVSHPVTQGLPSMIPLEGGLGSPSVDLVVPINESEMVSGYAGYDGCSIIAFSGEADLGSMVYFAFSIDGIADADQRELLIKNSIGYITFPTLTAWLSDYALQVNTSETIRVRVSDMNTGQPIKNATVTFAGCGVSVQNTTDNSGECSIFIAPTSPGIINVTVQKAGYLDFTAQIVVYSMPKFAVEITPERLKRKTQIVNISVTNFYEGNPVPDVNVTLVGCGVLETGFTNLTGDIHFVVTPTSYGNIELNASKQGFEDYTSLIGVYIKAVVVDSFGTDLPQYSLWDDLNYLWEDYGTIPIEVDIESLDKYGITYEDLVESDADVLIIPCAAATGREYTDSEISAIKNYTLEGHGLIATAGTFYMGVPNNNKLALLFGMKEDIVYTCAGVSSLNILEPTHPLFVNIPSPYYVGTGATACPQDHSWDPEDILDGVYVALSDFRESAIVVHRGAVFIGHWVGRYSNNYDLQLMYNAITWSKYQVPEHDIKVTLEAPDHLEPHQTASVNVTVSNVGMNNETDVQLRLLINRTIVDSAVISELLKGSSYTLSYDWTPTAEACYNVTGYAVPVPDENVTWNNAASKMVFVRYVTVALISDYSDLLVITPILDSMGIGYDIYNDNQIHLYTEDLNLLLNYQTVIFDNYNREITSSEHLALQSYLSSGGNLLVTGYDSLGSPSDPLLADIVRSSSIGDNVGESDLFVIEETHPIMDGPYGSFPAGYHISGLYSDCDAAEADTDRNAITVAELWDGYDKIIATDFLPGKVVYWNGRGAEDWTRNVDCQAILKNTLAWFTIQYEHDLAVILDAPTRLEPGDSVLLNATVYNAGLSDETNVELQLLINETIVDSVVFQELNSHEFCTLSYLWTPSVKGVYNVTAFAVPVPEENVTTNNVYSKMVHVVHFKYVLFDQTHGTDSISYYRTWVTYLTSREYIVDTLVSGPITSSALADYDAFVIPQAHAFYAPDELATIQNFVATGGGLLVIGDDNPQIYTDLTSFAGISWRSGGVSGITTEITPHPVTQGVASIYLNAPIAEMIVSDSAQDLVRDPVGGVMLAVSELPGKVIGFADENSLWDGGIACEDNLLLANNMIDWLATRYAHDLTIALEAPFMLEPEDSALLNATVYNVGLNNETNVELQLLINGTIVDSVTISELQVGSSHILSYLWTPVMENKYNVTAYVVPVPSENITTNNMQSTIVPVQILPDILVVADNDGGAHIHGTSLPEFQSALEAANYDCFVWDETSMGRPPLDFLTRFNLVIWTCGDYWNGAVDPVDARTLEAYLAQGGNIILEGEDIGYDHDGDRFMVNVAHAICQVDDTGAPGLTVTNPTHPVTRDLPTTITWTTDPPYDDGVSPTNGGFEVVKYTETEWSAVIVFEGTSLGYVVYYAFPLYCLEQAIRDTLVINSIKRDVAVVGVTASPTEVTAGENVIIEVTVENQGTITETFDVAVYYDDTLIGTSTVIDLAPYTSSNVFFCWDTSGVAGIVYKIKAVASAVPNEINAENNIFVDGAVSVYPPLDVYTQRGGRGEGAWSDAYAPQEEVIILASMNYKGDPLENKLVAFEVYDPTGDVWTFRSNSTNENGIVTVSFRIPTNPVFGTWSVVATADIAGQTFNDTVAFEVGWIIEIIRVETVDAYGDPKGVFAKGEHIYFNVTVQNIAFTAKEATITIVVYDECGVPVGLVTLQNWVIGPGRTEIFIIDLKIPRWAYVGGATVYANAYTRPPQEEGTPHCPEISTVFLIKAS